MPIPARTLACALVAALAVAPGCAPAAMAPPAPAAVVPAGSPRPARAYPTAAPWNPAAPAPAAAASAPAFVAAPLRPALLIGQAHLGAPLAGATVRLFDRTGKDLGQKAETDARGRFLVRTAGLPDRLELRTSGGTLDGQPFRGELRGAADLGELLGDHVALGAASTLEVAYLRKEAGVSRAAAQDRVATFLGLPRRLAPIRLEQKVDGRAVVQAAGAAGVDAYLAGLATEMLASPEARHPLGASVARSGENGLTSIAISYTMARGFAQPSGGFVNQGPGPTQATRDLAAALHAAGDRLGDRIAALDGYRAQVGHPSYGPAYDANVRPLLAQMQAIQASLAVVADAAASGDMAHANDVHNNTLSPLLDALPIDAVERFNAAIGGDDKGMGMAVAFNQYLVGGNGVFYSSFESHKMQRWWDEMDAVRTLLVYQMAEKRLHMGNDASYIGAYVVGPWLDRRRYELTTRLRGMWADTDTVWHPMTSQYVITSLNYVPDGYVYMYGQNLRWSARGVIYKYSPDWTDPEAADAAAQDAAMRVWGIQAWRLPTMGEVEALLAWDQGSSFVNDRLQKAPFRQFAGMGVVARADRPSEGKRNINQGEDKALWYDELPNPSDWNVPPYIWRGADRRTVYCESAMDGNASTMSCSLRVKAIHALYFDQGPTIWDYNAHEQYNATACVQYFVSDYDPAAEPHWW